ncbi:MAG: RNA pseudouridine synthase [Treponema sp.]|jgi:23S rRNA pseudouridine1911/1915/1917 synthase|nr:RNA pseudouridine synthase [Treponema sp.]
MRKGDFEKRVLFVNDDLIIVNKIAGESTDGVFKAGIIDLSKEISAYLGIDGKKNSFLPQAVHRLDVPVSGCVLFARNAKAAAFLGNCFAKSVYEEGRAEKYYWAVVENSLAFKKLPEAGELVHFIQINKKKNMSSAWDKPGKLRKEAVLRYRVKKGGVNYGFLEIELVTGRHHQIRAQFAALGIHIKGDLKYGSKRSESSGGIRLHSRSLYLPDPSLEGNFITVTADPPHIDRLWKDFAGLT